MRQVTLLGVILLLLPAALLGQAPAATGAKVAIIDFQAALAGNTLGKKAQDQLAAEVNKRQADMEKICRLHDVDQSSTWRTGPASPFPKEGKLGYVH